MSKAERQHKSEQIHICVSVDTVWMWRLLPLRVWGPACRDLPRTPRAWVTSGWRTTLRTLAQYSHQMRWLQRSNWRTGRWMLTSASAGDLCATGQHTWRPEGRENQHLAGQLSGRGWQPHTRIPHAAQRAGLYAGRSRMRTDGRKRVAILI